MSDKKGLPILNISLEQKYNSNLVQYKKQIMKELKEKTHCEICYSAEVIHFLLDHKQPD